MKNMLPYPGRYESHDSWMRRCDEWERNRDRSRRELAARCKNYGGYNYHAVEKGGTYELPLDNEGSARFDSQFGEPVGMPGAKIECVKIGRGSDKGDSFENQARKPGLRLICVKLYGNGFTSRRDYLLVKDTRPEPPPSMLECSREEIYNNDEH